MKAFIVVFLLALAVSPRSVVRPTCLGGWWLRRPSATPRRSDGDIASQRQDVPAFEAAARGSGACRGLVAGGGGRGRRRQRAQRLEVGRPLPARGRAGGSRIAPRQRLRCRRGRPPSVSS